MPTKQMRSTEIGNGLKGINFDAWGGVENFLRETSTGAGGTTKPQLLRRVNPWMAKATDMTAIAISELPFDILNDDGSIYDTSLDWQNKLGGMPSPNRLFYMLAASLCLGRAYVIPEYTSRAIIDLHFCPPHTVVPLITTNGLQQFSRTSDFGESGVYIPADMAQETNAPKSYRAYKETFRDLSFDTKSITFKGGAYTGEMMYFWLSDSDVELGPAKAFPASAALLPAELITAMDATLQTISSRGFVPPTLLSVKGNITKDTRDSTEAWYNRFLRRWSETVAKIINADAMDIKTIGAGMADLKGVYLQIKTQAMEDVAAAYGIPSAIFQSDKAFATEVDPMIKVWYSTSVFMKLYQTIEDTFNAQLLNRYKKTLVFHPEALPAFQDDENKRSNSYRELVSTDMRPSIAAEMLGLDLPARYLDEDGKAPKVLGADGQEVDFNPYSILDEFYNKRLAGATTAKPVNPSSDPAQPAVETTATPPTPQPAAPAKGITLDANELKDLSLWRDVAQRNYRKGKGMAVDFECKALPETIAGPIRAKLAAAGNELDIVKAFEIKLEPETYQYTSSLMVSREHADDIKLLADAINKAVGGVAI